MKIAFWIVIAAATITLLLTVPQWDVVINGLKL